MRQAGLSILLFFITGLLFGQAGNKSFTVIEGQVTDERYNPVSYVNIFIKSRITGAISDFYGNYQIAALPGDTITFTAVSYRKTSFIVPGDLESSAYRLNVRMISDTVGLEEVVIYPWPSSYKQFKEDFLDLEVEDPLANLDLHLPSPEELRDLARTPGEMGQVKIFSQPGPFSILYDQFSKEAKHRENYAIAMKKEGVFKKYNREVVSSVTGLKKEEEITAFMKFCPLDDKFILRSTDYDIFLAIRKCYEEFALLMVPADTIYSDTIR